MLYILYTPSLSVIVIQASINQFYFSKPSNISPKTQPKRNKITIPTNISCILLYPFCFRKSCQTAFQNTIANFFLRIKILSKFGSYRWRFVNVDLWLWLKNDASRPPIVFCPDFPGFPGLLGWLHDGHKGSFTRIN